MKKTVFFIGCCAFLSFILWCVDENGKVLFDCFSLKINSPLWLFVFVLLSGVGLLVCAIKAFIYEIAKQKTHVTQNYGIKAKKGFENEALVVLFKTMTATTEGDSKSARKHLKELEKIIGKGMMTDLLELKLLKSEKNFDAAQKLSLKLTESKESELVGLKALIEASSKKKDFEEALKSANRAFEARQDLYWVVENTFRLRALASDWRGALDVLEVGLKKKLIDHERYALLKAVTLYEIGLNEKKDAHELVFLRYLTEAHNLYPAFVPVALDLAELYEKQGQMRKAEKLLKEVWRLKPTYDVAQAYLKLFKTDSLLDKVQRMEGLAILNSKEPSLNNFLLAELDMKAKLFDKAYSELEIFLINNPATKKIAKLISLYEKQVRKNQKAALSWEKRAKVCEDDCLWVCSSCGEVSSKWKPVCKKCGKFNPFEWCLCLDKKEK